MFTIEWRGQGLFITTHLSTAFKVPQTVDPRFAIVLFSNAEPTMPTIHHNQIS